jgi:hypothetical protein
MNVSDPQIGVAIAQSNSDRQQARRLEIDSWPGQEIFIYFTVGPTQPAIQWKTEGGGLPPEVKRPEHEADHSPQLGPRLRIVGLYLHSTICLHGIMLN